VEILREKPLFPCCAKTSLHTKSFSIILILLKKTALSIKIPLWGEEQKNQTFSYSILTTKQLRATNHSLSREPAK
jgi:hypothetical protein